MEITWKEIAPQVWFKQLPLKLMGTQIGRNVTAFALGNDQVLVHSTAFFDEADALFLRELGSNIHFVDTTCFHDTCTRQTMETFPEASFYAPPGFPVTDNRLNPLLDLQALFGETLQWIPIDGMPKVNEVELFDPRNRLLVISDLLFNLTADTDSWTRNFFRMVAGIKVHPGVSRIFRLMIKDKSAFQESVDRLRSLDFKHLVVAHGEPIWDTGKEAFDQALKRHEY